MANLIPQIAEILGVGLGEEFEIKGRKGVAYKFIIDELIVSGSNNAEHGYTSANMVLASLVRGDAEIAKLPWKPTMYREYWTFGKIGKNGLWELSRGENSHMKFFYLTKAGFTARAKKRKPPCPKWLRKWE